MTPSPWFVWQDPFDGYWRVDHKLPDNSIIVGFIGQKDDAHLVAVAPELREALMELCKAIGDHPDSMTDGTPLNAAFIKAVEIVRKAFPPPEPLRNVLHIDVVTPNV